MDADARRCAEDALSELVVPCAMLDGLPRCRRMQIVCECGKAWDSHDMASPGVEGPRVPITSLIPLKGQGLSLGSLPDLGNFIRACFLRRYFTTKAIAAANRAAQWFEHSKRKRSAPGKAHEGSACAASSRAPSWIVACVLQDSIPCMQQLCRKNSRLHLAVSDTPTQAEVDAIMSLLYASMLKLYPRGHKVPPFTTRVAVCKRVLSMLNSPYESKLSFLEKHPNLVRFCVMEYCCNVISDYMPSELKALGQHGDVAGFIRGAGAMFDMWRREFLLTGEESLDTGDAMAKSAIERCLRSFKGGLRRSIHTRRTAAAQAQYIPEACWTTPFCHGNPHVIKDLLRGHSKDDLRIIARVQSMIRVFKAPNVIRAAQSSQLDARFGHCDMLRTAKRMAYVCVLCAINNKQWQTRLRLDLSNGSLVCENCRTCNILKVDMLGVILRVGDTHVSMCKTCCEIHAWRNGVFALGRCGACAQPAPASQKKRSCQLCPSVHVTGAPLVYPDPQRQAFVATYLCASHYPAPHQLRYVYTISQLQESLHRGKTAGKAHAR